jgi:hypothetical protein
LTTWRSVPITMWDRQMLAGWDRRWLQGREIWLKEAVRLRKEAGCDCGN